MRAALSDGQGSYLVAVLLLAAAALFLHRAMTPEWRYHDALKDLLNVTQEPFRGEDHPVLAAALFPVASWETCTDGRLLDWLDKAQAAFTEALRTRAPAAHVKAWPECQGDGCPAETMGLGAARRDDEVNRGIFVIPSTVATIFDNAPACPPGTSCGVQNASSVLEASRVLLQLWDEPNKPSGRAVASLRAMYFIDLLGDLRYISDAKFAGPGSAHRTFAGASYVYKALSRNDVCPGVSPGPRPIKTLPYIDVFGAGVVETLCYAIQPGDKVAGTLCFDVAPPEADVFGALRQARWMFDLHLVRHVGHPRDAFVPYTAPGLDEATKLSADELQRLRQAWNPSDRSSAGLSAIRIFGEQRDYFATTIFRHPAAPGAPDGGDDETLLVGRLVRSVTHDVAAAAVATLFALAAAGVVAAGLRRKARRLDLTLIRGLQVGVVEVDANDAIIGANDRCEEILGIPLPGFGDPQSAVDARLFGNQIEPEVVLLDDDGELRGQAVEFSHYREIEQQRRSGHTGSYYAFTKVHQQWIRASGSTIVKPGRTHHTFAMLDTYIDGAHLEKLQAARAAQARSS